MGKETRDQLALLTKEVEHIAIHRLSPLERVTTEMAAALIPHALVSHWSPHMLAQHAKAMAEAIMEVCDEPTKPE